MLDSAIATKKRQQVLSYLHSPNEVARRAEERRRELASLAEMPLDELKELSMTWLGVDPALVREAIATKEHGALG